VGATRLVLAFHKPPGLVTTRVDPGGRETVYESLRDLDRWVFPVGRLDRDTSGLLLLTNDTLLSRRLTDPKSHVARTYHARVRGHPDPKTMLALREGVDLGGGALTRPAQVRLLGSPRVERAEGGATWLEIVLTEGKKRQVRRMLANVGHDILTLVRVRIGRLGLGDLAPGEWRALGPEEEALLSSPGSSVVA
jgi:23S rRNA pseudouridine2605 synthase